MDVEGRGIIVADVAAQYRSEAFHGETMRIEMAASDFNKYGCDLVWRLADAATGREVARGKHGIMFFDYAERKPVAAPPEFVAKVGA
jgi:4-hydroxybenzoyl-CoA thioesterase